MNTTRHATDDGVLEVERRTRRRIRLIIAVSPAMTAIGLLAVAVVVAVSLGQWFGALGQPDTGERTHLKPIPVSKGACPYVVAIHNAANVFQSQTPVFGLIPEGPGQVLRWSPPVSHAADVLDVTIAAGIPHVPPPIRAYLMSVRVHIQRGRELAIPANDSDASLVEAALQSSMTSVQRPIDFAGDLVGHACSVDLGDNGAGPATHA